MPSNTRERIAHAAFDLFATDGFERTTIDQIAARAGVGRTTYFRYFPTKDAAVFPDHAAILDAVRARLESGDAETAAVALHEASRIVLRHYLAEGDLARKRYRLTRSVPALRDAEIAGQRAYQRLFRDQLRDWLSPVGDAGADDLAAEVGANAVVTAHNHVLRRWLRAETTTPEEDLKRAIEEYADRLLAARGHGTALLTRTVRDLDELAGRLRRALE
ncbi:MAG: helix-turn-helix domain-containing protein [Nocardioides sp.]|uniref:TetR/AcrR family transcriptional regulator n=1 Tax=Nocardioides sp. TaxID=35761 RepID=UPI0039E52F2D